MDTSTENGTPRISFIVVNYRSATLLPACFSSLKNISLPTECELIVANNDPDEEKTLGSLREKFPFTLVSCKENRGFGFAANRGAERARGDFLVFVNPDARFLSGDFSGVERLFDRHQSVGIVGFKLLTEPENPQKWSAGKRVTLFGLIRNHLGVSASESIWDARRPRAVDWVSGAAFVVKKADFFRIHGFDERFFLYYEDVDLCTRMKKLGKKIVFFPHIRLLHRGGGSMEDSGSFQKRQYRISRERYFFRHRPRYEHAMIVAIRKVFRI